MQTIGRLWSDAAALFVISIFVIEPLFDSHMASCWRHFEGWYDDGPRVYSAPMKEEEMLSMVGLLSCSDELRRDVDNVRPLPPGIWFIEDFCRSPTEMALCDPRWEFPQMMC